MAESTSEALPPVRGYFSDDIDVNTFGILWRHDLHNPVQTIIAAGDFAQVGDMSPAELLEATDIMEHGIGRLRNMLRGAREFLEAKNVRPDTTPSP